ncbi:MAG: M23 family metallopeptidase [Alphaproteobacteria bacterium]|jgi:murein DD-endopeptidase MepM/ murein hydrolase activator NlpD|nr:M23 family metallopeptidase [Alphaproteobacteria bacterium]
MFMRFIFILLLPFLLQACSTTKYSIDSYKKLTSDLQKNYKIKRADLVLSYDLARIDSTSCIFSKELGLFANDKIYAQKYLQKFKEKYRSNTPFAKEAKLKVQKITTLLTRLQNKYKILAKNHYQNVKKIAKADFTKVNSKAELAKLDQITSHLPLMLPSYNSYISSNYGIRKHPSNKKHKMHCGIDLVAGYHAPIYASANGKVSFVGHQNGYGTTVEISHENNIKTKYTHLKKTFVKKGQKVIRSQAIALQGRSGNAHGDHLHFEIHIAGKHVNPYDFIGHNYECFKR